jgi:hypothetical protein
VVAQKAVWVRLLCWTAIAKAQRDVVRVSVRGRQGRAAITVHKSGSAAVVWSGLDGLNLSRYYPGLGWAKTERVFAEHDGAHPWNPRTFIDDSCRLFVAWTEDGSSLYAPYAAVLR